MWERTPSYPLNAGLKELQTVDRVNTTLYVYDGKTTTTDICNMDAVVEALAFSLGFLAWVIVGIALPIETGGYRPWTGISSLHLRPMRIYGCPTPLTPLESTTAGNSHLY